MKNKYLFLTNEEFTRVLSEKSKSSSGETKDLLYCAGITIKTLGKANQEKLDKLLEVERQIDEVKEKICDEYCMFRGEYADQDDLWNEKCNECPLGQIGEII